MLTEFDLVIYTLEFLIPAVFCILFRAFGLGYRDRRKLILGLVVFAVYIILVPSSLITVLGYGWFTHVAPLVMLVGAMSALIFSVDTPGKTILLILIVGQMHTVVSVSLNFVRHLFQLSNLELDGLFLLVCSIVYVIALQFWAKPLRFIADNLYHRLTAAMMIPIIVTVIICIIPFYPAQNFELYPIYCTVLMLMVEIVFFFSLYTLYRSLRQISALPDQKLNAERLQLSAASTAERLHLMDETPDKQSLATHDRRHFNSMILQLLRQGKTEEAAAFLSRQHESTLPMGMCYCDNTAVNAIVCHNAALAVEKGIITEISLDIPNELSIDSLELAVALSNLLESAIHGCEALPQSENKKICFTCRHVGRLILEIKNPCVAETVLCKNGYPIPPQEGCELGTKSVLAFVKKYDAEIFYHVINGNFSVRMLV